MWDGKPVKVSETVQLFDPESRLPPPVDPTSVKVAIDPSIPLDSLGVHVSCQASFVLGLV